MSHVPRLALTARGVYRLGMKTSRARTVLGGVAGLAGLVAVWFATDASAQKVPPSAAALTCVMVTGEASYASVGYDHLVHLHNKCDKAAVCTVATNVNPEAATVSLAPGEKQTVVTWRGSPAREFTPDVSCRAR